MNDIRAQIESANLDFMRAFKSGDAGAVAACYTADAQLLPANSDFVRGTAAIREFWQRMLEMGIKNAALETVEVTALDDTAIEIGRYRIFVADDTLVDQGKYLVVWRNDNGAWKLHRDIWTTSQPAATASA